MRGSRARRPERNAPTRGARGVTTDMRTPDAAPGLVDRAPGRLRLYLRLMRADRPVGVWLLFWPCVWGAAVVRPPSVGFAEVAALSLLFAVGAFAMRSAGCVYNDVVDRRLDAQVARTASRPLASGAVSLRAAWGLIVGLCLIGLLVLLGLPLPAQVVALASLGLVAAYPFMKRITWWPQAWLGLTFNWGVLVGAAAMVGFLPLPALLAYAGGVAWTLGYDTIYACQDIEDDQLAGIKSSARALGDHARAGVAGSYAASALLLAGALWTAGAGTGAVLALMPAAHLAWQARRFDPSDGAACLALFKSNVWTGALVALAMLAT